MTIEVESFQGLHRNIEFYKQHPAPDRFQKAEDSLIKIKNELGDHAHRITFGLLLDEQYQTQLSLSLLGVTSDTHPSEIIGELYADEHAGWLPETTHGSTDTNRSWIFTLKPYLGNIDAVRICPADPAARQRATNNATSYVLNEYVAVDLRDPFGRTLESYRNLDRLRQPSRTMTVFICSDQYAPSVYNDHTHSRNWLKGWNAVTADIAPDRHRVGGANAEPTRGSANYLHADGHVEPIAPPRLKHRIERGENFAKPPE